MLSSLRCATFLGLTLAASALPFAGCTATGNTTQPAAGTPAAVTPAAVTPAAVTPAAPNSVAGRWVAEFDSQLGTQKYTFDFKLAGNTLSGTAVGQTADQPARDPIVLVDCTLNGNAIHFVEPRDFNGTATRIEYTGTVSGDTMQLKRAVGDIATTEAVAKRAP